MYNEYWNEYLNMKKFVRSLLDSPDYKLFENIWTLHFLIWNIEMFLIIFYR